MSEKPTENTSSDVFVSPGSWDTEVINVDFQD
jgi:hypothetical protein